MEILDMHALGRSTKNNSKIDSKKIYTKRTVDEIIINVDFDNIYNSFNIIKPLDNESIAQKYFKWINWNIYNNYIEFCNYLLEKISNSLNKSDISKIPLIISNLSNYRWSSKNYKNKKIIEKRSEIMTAYKNKISK